MNMMSIATNQWTLVELQSLEVVSKPLALRLGQPPIRQHRADQMRGENVRWSCSGPTLSCSLSSAHIVATNMIIQNLPFSSECR